MGHFDWYELEEYGEAKEGVQATTVSLEASQSGKKRVAIHGIDPMDVALIADKLKLPIDRERLSNREPYVITRLRLNDAYFTFFSRNIGRAKRLLKKRGKK